MKEDREGLVTDKHLLDTCKLSLGADFNRRLDNMVPLLNRKRISVNMKYSDSNEMRATQRYLVSLSKNTYVSTLQTFLLAVQTVEEQCVHMA